MTEQARQSTCVAIGNRAILIEGAPGTGKSSLALALIDRGATLIGDDSVILESREGRLFASPHPQTKGLLEVRNLGLIPLDCTQDVAVAVTLLLDEAAPRYIEQADTTIICGIAIPLIQLRPGTENMAIKAELALRLYGIGPE